MSQHPALVRFAYWFHCILALINVRYKSKAIKMPVKNTTQSHLAEAGRKPGFAQQQWAILPGISRTTAVMVEQNKRNLSADAHLKPAALEMSCKNLSIEPAPATSTFRMPLNYGYTRGLRISTSLLIQEAACDFKSRRLKTGLDNLLLQYERTIKTKAVQGGMDAGSSKIKRRREAAEATLARSNLASGQNCSEIGGSGVEIINVEL
ncbi:MAG: hypothetical protein JST02_05600 [Bacteroidetes bacterium]|nr:hypothetical protein [Bacteroidota bacterium]